MVRAARPAGGRDGGAGVPMPPHLAKHFVGLSFWALLAVAVSACGPASHPVAASPGALVMAAAHRAVSKNTAVLQLNGRVALGGQTIAISGSGQQDIGSDACRLDMAFSVGGQDFSEKILEVRGQAYISAEVHGHDVLSGKWAKYPLDLATVSIQSNPLAALELLEAKGARVEKLGAKRLAGQMAQGYRVGVAKKQVQVLADQELAHSSLSPASRRAAGQVVAAMPGRTYAVWLGRSHLVLEIETKMSLSGLGVVDLYVEMVKYAVPVSVSAPPPAQVVSYQRFKQLLTEQAG